MSDNQCRYTAQHALGLTERKLGFQHQSNILNRYVDIINRRQYSLLAEGKGLLLWQKQQEPVAGCTEALQ